jgi:TetR/AcrR family transcriptional regulator, fatty acid metabolism regulator protein
MNSSVNDMEFLNAGMGDALTSGPDSGSSGPKKRVASAIEKRRRIIESAERLFAQRGFLQTTVADISNDSGVHEASIFQYFKTKENLLVSIPERHMEKTLTGIAEHLQGMKGAEPKLRKLIWHQLRDLSLNRDYTSILLRELRTLPVFYESSAYEMLRRYSAFGVQVIREGIADGEVDPYVEPVLVLQMIFGAIDSVVLRWLLLDQPYDANHAADAMCSLVKGAIWRRPVTPQYENGDEPTRREMKRRLIVAAASEVFGKKGFSGATISEIAARAGIAEASIYQYFRNKGDLLLSVPGNWFNRLEDELQRCFSGRLNPAERLQYVLRRWYLDFQTREWETRVLILELYRNPRFYGSPAHKNTQGFWKLIRSIVEEGRETGIFKWDFEIDYYLHLVQGAFDHEALARLMLSKRKATLVGAEQLISLLLRAICA